MSTLLTAVEIANCFDNGGGRVVAASTTLDGECGEASPHGQKWKPGVWASIASRLVFGSLVRSGLLPSRGMDHNRDRSTEFGNP